MKRWLVAVAGLLVACYPLLRAGPGDAVSTDLPPQVLLQNPVTRDWPSYNGDYTGRRYSGLNQINTANAGKLAARWIFHARNSDRLEGTPQVFNGIMFVTAANDAFAIDARTGLTLWHYARPISKGLIDDAASHHNRGVALWHSRVFMETDNAHLLCLDARSGHLLWDIEYADTVTQNYGATSAPLIVKDKVLVGTSGGDDGVRGFVAAFDPLTGKECWRFWTIPAPGEPQAWQGQSYLRGGGTAWMPGTFDPELNTLYWGTGNPAPDFEGSSRPGDNLYTDCVVALDPDTGKLKWHYQFTPHDLYDYDAAETPVLVNAYYQGRERKLLLEANRNGFVYALDRTNGQFLSAVPFINKLNWAKSIDSRGKPILAGLIPDANGVRVCPGYAGATNWFSPSYNPDTHLLYFMALNACDVYYAKPQDYKAGVAYYATGVKAPPNEEEERWLLAYDFQSGKFAWRYRQAGHPAAGGTMTTAGGVVFFGDDAESLEALDARNGKPLWHFNTGQAITASPMSYEVDGEQYIAIAAGSDVLTFALPK